MLKVYDLRGWNGHGIFAVSRMSFSRSARLRGHTGQKVRAICVQLSNVHVSEAGIPTQHDHVGVYGHNLPDGHVTHREGRFTGQRSIPNKPAVLPHSSSWKLV